MGGITNYKRMIMCSVVCCSIEGGSLSRKAGDLESNNRKLRSANKDLEAERDKLQVWYMGHAQHKMHAHASLLLDAAVVSCLCGEAWLI